MKPAAGLQVTRHGRLVRPTGTALTTGGRGGSGSGGDISNFDDSSGFGDGRTGSDDGGSSGGGGLGRSVAAELANPLALLWLDPGKSLARSPPREIALRHVCSVAYGHKTPTFWQLAAHKGRAAVPAPELCFSLVTSDRTLDLAADSAAEARLWCRTLAELAALAAAGTGPRPPAAARAGSASGLSSFVPDLDPADLLPTAPSAPLPVTPTTPRGSISGGIMSARRGSVEASSVDVGQGEYGGGGGGDEGGSGVDSEVQAWRRRLFPAVRRGDMRAVRRELDGGCPVDLMEAGSGDTALLAACRAGHADVARLCLERGARNDPHPDFGQTALQAAVAAGRARCVRLILEAAAPSRANAIVANHEDSNGESPLHVASRRGNDVVVELLLHHGARLEPRDRLGGTCMHGAARAGHRGALALLLDAGGDALLEAADRHGNRPLHLAAWNGWLECTRLLLETAAEPGARNAAGDTPYALACRHRHFSIAEAILDYDPDAG
ncbi:unnamed protein product, partial [Phaeothamnion confervicola]